jgi:hypothetical protein
MSLKNGDLNGTILPEVSIDEFEPKAGEEKDVIVVAFYLTDKDPADDLNTFIQRSYIDTLDVEVSPSTDEEGRYLVFVEMSRDETFPGKFAALLDDVLNTTGPMDWKIRTYYSGKTEFELSDPDLLNFLILDPEQYVPKDKFEMDNINESIKEFFKESFATNLTVEQNTIKISHNGRSIVADVIDVGEYDTVVGRNFLKESAFGLSNIPYEAKILQSMIGYDVLPLGNYLVVNGDDKIMLLKNTQLTY